MKDFYEFKVPGPSVTNNTDDLVSSIINEANSQIEQQKLSLSINKRVMLEHKEILKDFANEVCVFLSKLGLDYSVSGVVQRAVTNNNYSNQGVVISIVKGTELLEVLQIGIHGEKYKSGEFKDSKYPTYSGEYKLYYDWNPSDSIVYATYYNEINSVEDIANKSRLTFIQAIKKSK
jgi:hypothetical protein